MNNFVYMKIDHYIGQLLYRYQCVTVPAFGAFLTEFQPARITAESGSFYPPGKAVLFNPHLKTNDGLLASHIATMENISYEVAVEKIQLQVDEWKYRLHHNVTITLNNIGDLNRNAEGNLIFTAASNINYNTSSFGLSAFVSPAVKREEKEPIIEEPAVENNDADEPIVLNRKGTYLKYAAALVVGLSTFAYFGDEYYRKQVALETQMVQMEVQKDVTNKIQEATFFISSPLPEVSLPVIEQKMPYHIVAGAFREEQNASRTFERLTQAGFKARRLDKNKYGLYPVLYGSYPSYKEAVEAMQHIHKTQSRDAWILIDQL
jgi:hypothetical protein